MPISPSSFSYQFVLIIHIHTKLITYLSSSLMDITESAKTPTQPQNPTKNHTLHENIGKNKLKSMRNNNGRKFLGVRQRPSGRWVAEIKNSSQKLRLWLGTFDTAEEAALAYDDAARLLRGRNAKTNFTNRHENITNHEENFSVMGHNPRPPKLLQHAMIMKSHASSSPSSSTTSLNSMKIPWLMGQTLGKNDEVVDCSITLDAHVEEAVVCSSSYTSDQNNNIVGSCSKVYSSVRVAPSFSASPCPGMDHQGDI